MVNFELQKIDAFSITDKILQIINQFCSSRRQITHISTLANGIVLEQVNDVFGYEISATFFATWRDTK